MNNDDTTTLFEPEPDEPPQISLRQGIVQSWNAATGENTVQFAGSVLANVQALKSESANLVAGDVVALLVTGDQCIVLGKVTTPGNPGTVPSWNGDILALEGRFPVTTPDIAAAAVTTPKIDIAAVTSSQTEFRPGGGMLSNLIPDPEFIDPAWRDQRTANEGWSTWTFSQIPNLAPSTLAGYTFGAKVTGNSVTLYDKPKDSYAVAMTVNTALVAADVLFTSAAAAVTGSRVYQAALNASRDQTGLAAEVEWLTSGMVSISTSPLPNVGSVTSFNVTSPSNAAFGRIRLKATGAVGIGSIVAFGTALYLGGAGIEPGDWTAAIDFGPSYVGFDEIYLVRNLPISRVQDYYGDITGIAVNAEAHFVLREYDADGNITESTTVGQPTVSTQPTPAWKGDSGPVSAVGKNTVRADLMLQAGPVTSGQAGRIEFTQPILVITGFTSRDENRRAILSPKQFQMAGEAVTVYMDSDEGVSIFESPTFSFGDGTNAIGFAGKNVTGADLSSPTNTFPANPQAVAVSDSTGTGAVTITQTFVPGSPLVGTAFTAPKSGSVLITVGGRIENGTAGNTAYLSFEVRTGATIGSGTVVLAADAGARSLAAGTAAAARNGGSRGPFLITGLTPGASYNVRTMFAGQTASGSATFFNRELLVQPVL